MTNNLYVFVLVFSQGRNKLCYCKPSGSHRADSGEVAIVFNDLESSASALGDKNKITINKAHFTVEYILQS